MENNNNEEINTDGKDEINAADTEIPAVPCTDDTFADDTAREQKENTLSGASHDGGENGSDKKKGSHKSFIMGMAAGAIAIIAAEASIFCASGIGGTDKINILGFDKKLKEIETLIDYTYLYDADKQKLEDGMFTGLVYGLTDDRYSAYYSKSVYDEEKKRLNGNYVGIGVTISKDPDTGGILVNAVNADGPAAKAGIRIGDIITAADGADLTQKDTDFAVSLITGEVGTAVDITLLRDGKELSFTVERANITTVSVQSDVIDENEIKSVSESGGKTGISGTNIGYISITAFNQQTKQEFVDKLDDLAEDKQVDGIVIDLRNNGGGDMNICLEMLDMILPDSGISVIPDADSDADGKTKEGSGQEKGKESNSENGSAEENAQETASAQKKTGKEISLAPDGSKADAADTLLLSVENKNGEADKYYAGDGWSNDIPIVVVVNGNSASASEIFAGVLRDYGYQIVGEKTFGKGIVQSLYPLSDGSAVKFTTEQYRLPGGELIHGKGITPTIEVPFEEYDGVTADTVNYADGNEQPDMTKDSQIAAAVNEIERQVYEAYQKQ